MKMTAIIDNCNSEKYFDECIQSVIVTPLGVAEQFFIAAETSTLEKLKRKIGIKYGQKVMLSVCTLEPRKNITCLTEQFIKAKQDGSLDSEWVLVLAGAKGWLIEEWHNHVLDNAQDVIITGYLDDEDLPALYQLSEIFIFPSFYEGFGLPIIEAMASGTPVACSNTSSMKEAGGSKSLKFDPHKPIEVYEPLLKIQDLSHKGRLLDILCNEHLKKLTWKNYAQITYNAYKKYS